MNQSDKAKAFAALHQRESAFVIPNPWDAGSAKLLAALGFEALASTSWGFAVARGRLDGGMSLDETLVHLRELSAATPLPVSADFQNAFADDPKQAAKHILQAAQTGIVGCSIEDSTGDAAKPVYDFSLAVERVSAAVEAARSLDFPFILTARAENFLHGCKDMDDTIRRLQAFEAAGADVLYAPGLATLDQVRAVTGAVGKPVNVLAPMVKGTTVAQLAEVGAKRISIGGALMQATMAALVRAAKQIRDTGSFTWLSELMPPADRSHLLEQGGFRAKAPL